QIAFIATSIRHPRRRISPTTRRRDPAPRFRKSLSCAVRFASPSPAAGGLTATDTPPDNPREQTAACGVSAMNRTSAADPDLVSRKTKMISGTYLRNAWYVAAWSDDLADGQLIGRTILKQPVVLYRSADGKVAALEDRCPHRFAPLHMGKIVGGDRIQCPYH